jgi:hypothetical protein
VRRRFLFDCGDSNKIGAIMPQYFPFSEAAKHHLPDRPHQNTVRRWATIGVNGVKLRSVRFGGKRLTTEQWCREFVEAVTAASGQTSEHAKAEAKLEALGV